MVQPLIPSFKYQEILALKDSGIRTNMIAKQYNVDPNIISAILRSARLGFDNTYMYSRWQDFRKEGESPKDFCERYAKERGWNSYESFKRLKDDPCTVEIIKRNLSTLLMEVGIKEGACKTASLARFFRIGETTLAGFLDERTMPRETGNLDWILAEINQSLETEYRFFDDLIFLYEESKYDGIKKKYKEKSLLSREKKDLQTVGSFLSSKLIEKNLTIEGLARQIPNCQPSSISGIFNDNFNGNNKFLTAVGIILGVSIPEINGIRNKAK